MNTGEVQMNYKVKCSDCKQPSYVTEVRTGWGAVAWLCDKCLKLSGHRLQ
jgi:ribosomal protein L37AE/L43A